jgi:hypothetical protein
MPQAAVLKPSQYWHLLRVTRATRAFDGSNASIFRIGDQDRLPDFPLFQRAGKDE